MGFRAILLTLLTVALCGPGCSADEPEGRPGILLFVTDDQSWLHTSIAGDPTIATPAFDRVAREGVLFENAHVASPICTPSRSAILTGQEVWRLEEGGRFGETLPMKFDVFPLLLEEAGYFVGWTGKGWGPGYLKLGGWGERTPTGREYNDLRTARADVEKYRVDYAANFEAFLADVPEGEPFFFWCGTAQPHRPYVEGSGLRAGKRLEDVVVPGHLPDVEAVRSDLLDFAVAVEYADSHLERVLQALEARGALDDTLVLVTSDNGVALPRAKDWLYDLGSRVPLAVSWPARVPPGRLVDDFVSLTDLAPTVLEAAGVPIPAAMTGRSLLGILESRESGRVDPERDFVVTARQSDHSMRAIRTDTYLYVRNLVPGFQAPDDYLSRFDDHPDYWTYYKLLCQKPPEELYDVRNDPWQVVDLAEDPDHHATLVEARERLDAYLEATDDPY